MASVSIDGLDELRTVAVALGTSGERLAVGAERVVAKIGHDVEADAKRIAPVDTGHLRNSIGTSITDGGLGAEVTAAASYSGYVEYGTSRMSPQPYMGPAFLRHVEPFVDALTRIAGDL